MVRMSCRLPPEVAEWLARKAASSFKGVGVYQRDIWVAAYKREQKEASSNG
jgi:hypothetical protein